MIFVTVGTQLPFDRLICAVDEIAADLHGEEIIAQTNGGVYIPVHINTFNYVCATDFDALLTKARLVISHAGIGTIISALMKKKPIIIMPRLAFLGEHRNEHQLATAMKVNELNYVHVAYDKKQLRDLLLNGDIQNLQCIGDYASEELIRSVFDFIHAKK